ncbi:hypothetical protein A3H10_04000 [Candidatus Uhrbacteria bacterium RIFCSPLOWO2_12_FULL_46_10]|uniref:Restriction endonuclease type II-like domain-containing protein n=1 Tax=Candidatus Uhrbacteria bacterium RIFCSPLOWO2_01_FULL_47_25 TaxID=1802402 RepID=A0A1F7UY02_9BACT|nr:MAG: hypothetical protein A2752_01615 [Candidatus Uhrbacteria bacterium RIFCSPHIGHO2_01_FULL_46_23]OGL70644.1 MAG: hypothetical protein A3D60_04235 [Candidatus Uhrbacteria bacterium RIFCSPHIGHO2_02_FULL_47_29]OGL76410.1 MAG: hypothetical protein A3E96_02255 [Candidatus Uhrbacteria bacterium RIFCSPHIGHO2_12_FULL_46_13]OGL83151.1 MAG: hypothetical protein A2936_01460 [Candidatus Uhrbacteria bacterium RIFCSPLOWO2_01_FULL_47_25]OGL84059.1 MAG: hypothetical protein A3I37_01755 [Candidatus Uhrbact
MLNGRRETQTAGGVVLVGVLRSKNDRKILLQKHWYRIPIAFLPKRHFDYLAFYQPVLFGKRGKRIEYYGRITKIEKVKRIDLLPAERVHPRTHDDYMKFKFSKIEKLARPIKNIIPRRVSFGFTSFSKLSSSRNILELYNVPPIEQIIKKGLDRLGIKSRREYTISRGRRRYRIDLVVFCNRGTIAIECDNYKSHSGKLQIRKDKMKDAFLEQLGWCVIRLKEKDIIERPSYCLNRVQKIFQNFRGQK